MSEPDSKEFARQVLHNLAALSAETHGNTMLLCELLSHVKNRPVEEFLKSYMERVIPMTDANYREALEETGLDDPLGDASASGSPSGDEDGPSDDFLPPRDRGANPRV